MTFYSEYDALIGSIKSNTKKISSWNLKLEPKVLADYLVSLFQLLEDITQKINISEKTIMTIPEDLPKQVSTDRKKAQQLSNDYRILKIKNQLLDLEKTIEKKLSDYKSKQEAYTEYENSVLNKNLVLETIEKTQKELKGATILSKIAQISSHA